ncbi:hypothetical protein BX600DRAFT_499696 [Xylariales sp. PMI_506]|nr:hypothetical protein BX600DRAFT_499696 [Xylariales sp. PMI_506]
MSLITVNPPPVYVAGGKPSSTVPLSGVGSRLQFSDAIPDDSVAQDYNDGDRSPAMMEISLMPTSFGRPSLAIPPVTAPRACGFPFHTACWHIMGNLPLQYHADSQAVFNLCLSSLSSLAQFLGHADLEIEQHDLFDIPALRNVFELETDKNDIPRHMELLSSRHSTDTKGSFRELPAEILELILLYLPSVDVVRLKQASCVFANVALSDMFWRSRFGPGRELDVVFESRADFPSHRGHWRQLYISAKRLSDHHPALANRRRVWALASSLQHLLYRMSSVCCDGSPVRSLFEPTAPLDSRQWITASRALKALVQSFGTGSRVLYERFHVAHDQQGIRGLAALSHVDMPAADWAGEYPDIPKRRLALNNIDSDTKVAFKAGFDALKMVTLSISHQSPAPTELVTKPSFRNTALWFPDIPDPCLLFRGVEPFQSSDPHQDLPIITDIFGGNNGHYLPYVLGITVWIGKDDQLLDLEVSLSTEYKPGKLAQNNPIGTTRSKWYWTAQVGSALLGWMCFTAGTAR